MSDARSCKWLGQADEPSALCLPLAGETVHRAIKLQIVSYKLLLDRQTFSGLQDHFVLCSKRMRTENPVLLASSLGWTARDHTLDDKRAHNRCTAARPHAITSLCLCTRETRRSNFHTQPRTRPMCQMLVTLLDAPPHSCMLSYLHISP